MLVLSRHKTGKVVIRTPDGDLLGSVVVTDIRGDKVRIGFEFPKEYAVHREEVDTAILQELKLKQSSEQLEEPVA